MIKTKTFKSGLRLCIDKSHNSQLVAVSIGVMAGSQNESKKEWGLAHFLEHLFFKSTAFHSSEFLQEQLSGFGAYINANTGENSTHYILKSSKSKI
ncbi:MAG: insulinase family protein, partial [Clostridia bacterium]